MSLAPANDAKEQIRQAIDIVDVVGGYISLRRAGRVFKGLCPFHDDRDPSLQVSPERQSWKCWVCDDGGDIFSFLMKKEGIDFREALEMLAERAGIDLNPTPSAPVVPGSPDDKQTLYRAAKWADEQFRQFLLQAPEAAAARTYLQQRGVDDASCERYGLGYSDNGWQWLLDRAKKTPYSPAVLQAVGLVNKNENSGRFYDVFRGRVMFPIRDTQSRTIAFGGRILPEIAQAETTADRRPPAKYINSPETRLFSKSEQVYALDLVRDAVSKSRHVVVVEGYTDAIAAGQYGIDNVVAVLGTALGERHIHLLKRFADRVTLVLDGDAAGQRRANEVLGLFVAAQMDLRILTLPDQLDPCDFLQQRGPEAFQQLLETASDALEHKVRIATRGINLLTDTHRAFRALEEILETLAQAPRPQDAASPQSQMLFDQQLVTRLARDFQVGEAEIRSRLLDMRRRKTTPARESSAEAPRKPATLASLQARELELFEVLTQHPELTSLALAEIRNVELTDGPARRIFSVYRSLYNAGRSVDFSAVLSDLSPDEQPLFVALDEIAAAKAEESFAEPLARLQEVINGFRQQHAALVQKGKLAQLEKPQTDSQGALEILKDLVQQERHRRGISQPTDG
ncbi:DNA primase [Lignipirellula cremea]|uniref:DNA primase n=1 Tax=Lignipirellula cremea TaxID=2528010 RepID=A0A518DQ22_9BACT|nr:DNA primase [Lignipirellula cremea]QDU93945.1 DNA primase [Lignipirellula cremea]